MDFLISSYSMVAAVSAPMPPDFVGPTQAVPMEVVRFSAAFELNGIPTAVVSVVTGRRADAMGVLATIDGVVSGRTPMKIAPISVYLKVQPTPAIGWAEMFSEANAWPRNPDGSGAWFRAFRGYVTGISGLDTPNSSEATLYLTHWLADLNFSSALSRTSHPANVNQMSRKLSITDPSGTGGALTHATPATLAALVVGTPEVIGTDFWANNADYAPGGVKQGLRSWFRYLCEQNRMLDSGITGGLFPGGPTLEQNWEAARALQHFEPYASYRVGWQAIPQKESGYVDGVPLRIDMAGVAAPAANGLADSIAGIVAKETFETTEGFTIWDKLVGQLAPTFLLGVVPMIEKALVVPYNPGLLWNEEAPACRYIAGYEYSHLEFSSSIVRPLKAVVLMTPAAMHTGAATNDKAPIIYDTSTPRYVSADPANAGGLYLFKALPPWLSDLARPIMRGSATKTGADTRSPGAGPPPTSEPGTVYSDLGIQGLWRSYAKALYLQEVTKGRQLSMTGRLRFDIAPGTCVCIGRRTASSNYLSGGVASNMHETSHLFGTVLGVTINIDAVNPSATTSLRVGFVYDNADIAQGDLVTDAHPVWKDVFYGAPLASWNPQGNDPFHHPATRQMPPWEAI